MIVRLTASAALAMVLSLPIVIGAGGARADEAAANACAAQLPKDAQAIFDATLPQLTANADLRSLVTANTRKLAMAGTINRGSARQSAVAAGKCLQLVGG
ncbi:MAG TPA: hypothetical protein VMA37_15330 [Acetobacteraceae bacterium]|nr:hypothetical protein [Acetobacteraceae bacterium]